MSKEKKLFLVKETRGNMNRRGYEVSRYMHNTRLSTRKSYVNFLKVKQPSKVQSKKLVTNEELVEVDIVGFRQIVRPNATVWWKLLWVMLSVGALLGCSYQCGERVMYYLSDPSEVSTYFVRNKTITLPSITICPFGSLFSPFVLNSKTPVINAALLRERVGPTDVIKPIKEIFAIRNLTIDDLWKVARWNVTLIQFAPDLKLTKSAEELEKGRSFISEIDTGFGRCLSFKAKPNIKFPGLQNSELIQLHGFNKFLKGNVIFWHNHDDVDLVKYSILFNNKFLPKANGWEIFFRVSEVIYRNTKESPCEENSKTANKCLIDCIEKNVYSNVTNKCRLPYMQNSFTILPCTTFEELQEVLSATVSVMEDFVEDECKCPRKCSETVYSLQYISPTESSVNVAVFFGNLAIREITVIKELAGYSGFSLFSDLGGSIGLYLGISALQIFEIVISVFKAKI